MSAKFPRGGGGGGAGHFLARSLNILQVPRECENIYSELCNIGLFFILRIMKDCCFFYIEDNVRLYYILRIM